MYSMAVLRLAFSITTVLTCPAIIYSKNIKSLYIIKNGYNFPTPLGNTFLSLFVAFIVMSCNGPAVQYLQVANLLSKSSHKELSKTISIMPIVVVVTSLILIFFGYIPPLYEIHISSFLLEKLAEQGETAFLIITVQLFILPFITIHIPFYIIVILPFFGIAGRILADRFLYLFCWCPAINPILVIVMVKVN
ncbi:hypothetical protein B9Z55_013251 [Caenorhabditis nigoni]|nr:hypothetical protein B9Z55_013251 [Caenorhabditis nigoni]